MVDFAPGRGVSGRLSGEAAPRFSQSIFHSPEPLCVSFLSLASVSLLPVPSGSPRRTATTPILLTACPGGSTHYVLSEQLGSARWHPAAAGGPRRAQRRRQDTAMGGKESVGRGCSLGRQYLVAKVTSSRHGDVAVETNHLGREGGSEGEAVGGAGGGRGPQALPAARWL